MPVISQKELDKFKTGAGLYSKMREGGGTESLKLAVISIVEASFRDYAKAHKGCDKVMEDREWKRFHKFLLKYL